MLSEQSQGITVLTENVDFGLRWEEPCFFLPVLYNTKQFINPQIIKYHNEPTDTLRSKLKHALAPNPKT